jgi:hypothetical protein
MWSSSRSANAWGLDDFDDSTRGPEFVDIIRFLGSIDLATRQRGWTSDGALGPFLRAISSGLSTPDYRPPEPDIVRHLRGQRPVTRGFLAWGESQMQRMEDAISKYVIEAMKGVERVMRLEELLAGWRGAGNTMNRHRWLAIP